MCSPFWIFGLCVGVKVDFLVFLVIVLLVLSLELLGAVDLGIAPRLVLFPSLPLPAMPLSLAGVFSLIRFGLGPSPLACMGLLVIVGLCPSPLA